MSAGPVKKTSATARAKPAAAAPKPAAVNPHRGETSIRLGDKDFPLCLTMNALVEIENAMGVPLAKLGEVLTQPSMTQIRTLIGALVRGGGAKSPTRVLQADDEQGERPAPLSDEELGAYPFSLDKAIAAIEAAFASAGVFSPGVVEERAEGNAPSPTQPN